MVVFQKVWNGGMRLLCRGCRPLRYHLQIWHHQASAHQKWQWHFVPHGQSHPLRLRNCSGSVGSIRNNQCTHTGLITEATGAKASKASQSFSMADLPCCGQQPVSQHTSCASLPRQGRQLLSGRPRPVPALGGAQPGDQGGGQTTALDAGDPEISWDHPGDLWESVTGTIKWQEKISLMYQTHAIKNEGARKTFNTNTNNSIQYSQTTNSCLTHAWVKTC